MNRWQRIVFGLTLAITVVAGVFPNVHRAKARKYGATSTWLDNVLMKQVQSAGVTQPTRTSINFVGGATITDNPGNDSTDISVSSTGASPVFFSSLASTVPTGSRQVVFLDGYSAVGDGGGGLFAWDAANTSANDSCTVVKVTSITTGRWVREAKSNANYLNVRWCGARGDGVTNDTDAIMLGYATFPANLGGTLFFPAGTYLANSTGTNTSGLKFLANPVRLLGASGRGNPLNASPWTQAASRIHITDTTHPAVFFAGPTVSTYGSTIDQLGFYGTQSGTGQHGVVIDGHVNINYTEIAGFGGNGLEIRYAVGAVYTNVTIFDNNGEGVNLDTTNSIETLPATYNNHFFNVRSYNNGKDGTRIFAAANGGAWGNRWYGGDNELNGTTHSVAGGTGNAVSPIEITDTNYAAAGWATGDVIFLTGVTGNTNANGAFRIATVDSTHYNLLNPDGTNTTGNGTFGGTVTAKIGFGFLLDSNAAAGGSGNFGNGSTGIWDENNKAGSIRFHGTIVERSDFTFAKLAPLANTASFYSQPAADNSVSGMNLASVEQRTQQGSLYRSAGGLNSSDLDTIVFRDQGDDADGRVRAANLSITFPLSTPINTSTASLAVPYQEAINVSNGYGLASCNHAGTCANFGTGFYTLIAANAADQVSLGGLGDAVSPTVQPVVFARQRRATITAATYTVDSVSGVTDDIVPVDSSSNAITITGPANVKGRCFTVKDVGGTAGVALTHNETIVPASGTIDGAANFVISIGRNSATFCANGSTNWDVL